MDIYTISKVRERKIEAKRGGGRRRRKSERERGGGGERERVTGRTDLFCVCEGEGENESLHDLVVERRPFNFNLRALNVLIHLSRPVPLFSVISVEDGYLSFTIISRARSVADIGDHGLPTLSVVSSPDKLIVGRFFPCYEIIQTVCVFCALSSSAFGTTNLSTLIYSRKITVLPWPKRYVWPAQ